MIALMPRGVCAGCGELTCLPPFGDGMCFLCATDGPPGEYSPTIGAVGEDVDARRVWPEMTEADEERRIFILEEFAAHQAAWGRKINLAHHCSQRFDLEATAIVSRGDRALAGAALPSFLWEFQRIIERSAGHEAHAVGVLKTIERRRGAGHYSDAAAIERAIELRKEGWSLRAIARETGINKVTVMAYVPVISKAEAMRLMHQRLKAEGRPMTPPYIRNRALKRSVA